MPSVDFSQYYYFPVLAANDVSALAYTQLSEQTKQDILPIFELCRRRQEDNFDHSILQLNSEIQAERFLIDIDKREAPAVYVSRNPADAAMEARRVEQQTISRDAFNANLRSLLNPTNGFANWREFSASFANAVPVLQYSNVSSQRHNIIRQAALLAANNQSICLRIGQTQSEELCDIAADILAILPSSSQLLLNL